jgi:uncharacterized protein (DUF58 family)
MTEVFDEAAVERAVRTYRLAVPRSARSGRVGGVLGARAGGSMELHDFRAYQPGDDLRQLDWNAMARTEQLIVRVRREEVSPRVELLVDASRSMTVSAVKSTRTRELATVLARIAQAQGLDPSVVLAGPEPRRAHDALPRLLRTFPFEAALPLTESLRRAPVLRTCGIRVVLSDFLFDVPLDALLGRLAEGAASLVLVQILADDDLAPEPGGTVTLVDSETGERLDRELDERVLASYERRFRAHQAALAAAARRVRGDVRTLAASRPLEESLRSELAGHLLEVRG